MKPEQVVILCGGLGTRLLPYTSQMPKPMILCDGRPFLWHLMQQLNDQGFTRFLLLTGYLSDQIESYFNDGIEFGWDVTYSRGPIEWDTGRRLLEAKSLIDKCFLLMYSDNFAPFDFERLYEIHSASNLPLSLMIFPKSPGNIQLADDGRITEYNNDRSDDSLKYVEIGYMIVNKRVLFENITNPDCGLPSVLRALVDTGQINGYRQCDQYHSISDPIRWKKTEAYLRQKKIILLDRDGIINKKAPKGEYISRWEAFDWIEDTLTALKFLAFYSLLNFPCKKSSRY